MEKNAWTYIFGAIGALSGIVYLYNARNATSASPVTNVFPPLNTPDPATTESYGDPLPTTTTAATTVQTTGKQPVTIYAAQMV